jgi:hypothetical protein
MFCLQITSVSIHSHQTLKMENSSFKLDASESDSNLGDQIFHPTFIQHRVCRS